LVYEDINSTDKELTLSSSVNFLITNWLLIINGSDKPMKKRTITATEGRDSCKETTRSLNMAVFWVVAPCSLVDSD
jgi:hypothetical protein